MRLAKLILAGSMLTFISPVTWAQQPLTGMVTTIDRINGTIAIKRSQSGTVGANADGPVEKYKVQGSMLDAVHAGDRVSFTVGESGGTKALTKLEKQKP